MVRMLEHVGQHAAFYRVMLGPQGDPAFVARIRGLSEQRLRSLLPGDAAPPPGGPPRGLCLSFLAHAGIGALAWWLETEPPPSPAQVAAWLDRLNRATLDSLLEQAPASGVPPSSAARGGDRPPADLGATPPCASAAPRSSMSRPSEGTRYCREV